MKLEDELIALSMADGVGTGHHALNMLNIKHRYLAVEINKTKREAADFNAEIERPVNDIYELLSWLESNIEIAKRIGIVFCGFTCKSLSSQGKREEWDGESKIFFETVKVLEFIKLLNPDVKFLFENVASMSNKCRDDISLKLGVDYFLLNSSDISPQARERYYWFNWPSFEIKKRNCDVRDYLDDDGLELVAFTKSNRGNGVVKGRIRLDHKAATLVTGKGCKGQSTMNAVITKKMKFRDITRGEALRLQGIDFLTLDSFSDGQVFEIVGEGWEFYAIMEIVKNSGLL